MFRYTKIASSTMYVLFELPFTETEVSHLNKSYNLPCNIANTLDIIGDRWTLLIIRDLLLSRRRFNDLKGSLEGISPNILSDRLQSLEKSGIITSRLYSQHPPRYEYKLTPKGYELKHVLAAIAIWGNRNLETTYTRLVHSDCGTEVELSYYCPHCDKHTGDIALEPVSLR